MVYTFGQVATRFGIPLHRLQYLASQGRIPVTGRAGRLRVVSESDLPRVEQALVDAGILPGAGAR